MKLRDAERPTLWGPPGRVPVGWRKRGITLPSESHGDQSTSAGREMPGWQNLLVLSLDIQAVCSGQDLAPKCMQYTYSTQGECVWNVSITSKIMFNMFQTYCIKQIPKQYLKHILFFILIDCKCIKHMLRIYFIYCICKILSNLYRRKPQSHHRIGPRAILFCKLTF